MPVMARSSWMPSTLAALLLSVIWGRAGAAPDGRVQPDPRQRQAVRGEPVEGSDSDETAELRELRRFERQAFTRHPGVPAAITEPEVTGGEKRGIVPPGLRGNWSGSGDVPPVLRSPDARELEPETGGGPPAWLRTLSLPELPVRWDARVLKYLDYFKNDERGRNIMASWLRRLGRYRDTFERILVEQGLPRDLIYLAMIESGFATAATSNVGAGGVWQFMTGAARAYGLEVSHWVDARRDPERAAEAAAHYLKDLYVRFGSWHLAFAAYNAGYGAVLQSIARYNTNDFWELCRHEAGLPWETTLYVPKIVAAAIVGHNLQAFGYGDVLPDPPLAYDEVVVPPGTTLAAVARAVNAKVEDIEALNPELLRGRVPPDRDAQPVRLPPGTAATFAQGFARARTAVDAVETVVLRYGETLDDVAKRVGTSVKELRKLNRITSSSEVRGGTAIVVPDRKGAGAMATAIDEKLAAASAAGGASESLEDFTLVAVPEKPFHYPGRERVFYRVRSGDTLSELGGVFGVSTANLIEWNNLDPDARLQTGMIMQVFVPKDFDRDAVALLDPAHVRVVTLGSEEFLELQAAVRGKTRLQYQARQGETLAKVARRYGLTAGDLARINRLSFNTELKDGQTIIVYAPSAESAREHLGRRPPTPAVRGAKDGDDGPRPRERPAAPADKKSDPKADKPDTKAETSKPDADKKKPRAEGETQAGAAVVAMGSPERPAAAPGKKSKAAEPKGEGEPPAAAAEAPAAPAAPPAEAPGEPPAVEPPPVVPPPAGDATEPPAFGGDAPSP